MPRIKRIIGKTISIRSIRLRPGSISIACSLDKVMFAYFVVFKY